jgi:hydroxymethylbilane synthase
MLEPERFLPAPAQGALAVQVRADDAATRMIVEAIDDRQTRTLVEAERIVLRRLHPGCHAPVGVYARRVGQRIVMSAFASRPDGTDELRCQVEGNFAAAQAVAEGLAEKMISGGAIDILEEG